MIPYIPVPPTSGGTLRIYHILRHLVSTYDVTVVGFGEYGDISAFYEHFPSLRGKTHFIRRPFKVKYKRIVQLYSLFTSHSSWYIREECRAMGKKLDELLGSMPFDIIHAEFPLMAHFEMSSNALKILDAHNVEYDNFRRMANLKGDFLRGYYYRREYRKFYLEEITVCRKQDAIFTTSYRDRSLFDKDTPCVPKFVIPNGVDTSYFYPGDTKPEPYSLVFTGMMGYVPNYDGVLYFLDEVFPRIVNEVPEAKMYIVGKNPPKILRKRRSDRVVITGFVDDVRPYIRKASVYVVPLRMGGGTRLKVLEALSMEKAVVTTHIGAEGIGAEGGQTVLYADKAPEFAAAVIRLLKNRTLAKKMGKSGRDFVIGQFDWKVVTSWIDEAYAILLAEKEQPEILQHDLL